MSRAYSILYESHLRELGVKWRCCGSCHDDEDLGYASLPAQSGPDGAELHGCCGTPEVTDQQWTEMLRRVSVKGEAWQA